jgi:hypothetical protein
MDDLAYYLGVSVKILTKRLGYLALKKQMLDLGENKYLVLTNLPSLYVYESIGLKHGN